MYPVIMRRVLQKFCLAACFGLMAPTVSAATPYAQLIVFGDSLSDPGNAYAMTGGLFPPAPYAHTFSNGATAAQYMASSLGASLTDYAIGGAMTDSQNYLALTTPALAPVLGNTGISTQIANWNPASVNLSSALFMVWGGPNDFSYAFGRAAAGEVVDFNALVASTVNNVVNDVLSLASKGAHDFFVPNMPDLGLTPRAAANGASFAALATTLSNAYNAGLAQALNGLHNSLGLTIYSFDTAGYMSSIIANPSSVGLSNVTTPCISAGAATIAGGCAGYLYFDDIHPTTYAHSLIGGEFAQAVPEPVAAVMLLAGLGVLGLMKRRITA